MSLKTYALFEKTWLQKPKSLAWVEFLQGRDKGRLLYLSVQGAP